MFYTLSTNRVTPYIANFRRTRSYFLSQITILNHFSPFASFHGGYIHPVGSGKRSCERQRAYPRFTQELEGCCCIHLYPSYQFALTKLTGKQETMAENNITGIPAQNFARINGDGIRYKRYEYMYNMHQRQPTKCNIAVRKSADSNLINEL